MNYIEYMKSGGASGNDTTTVILLPPHLGFKELSWTKEQLKNKEYGSTYKY